ncbi:hypothetical protein QNI19_28055 [Cytophagaceae bacterium DM2B3-1]|uniref:Uncharacterized protein n=1 Tax=Xanthocytophaga flava TaxID=3048013 RepID=A0ABT7CTI9_9BACT|nr:hypothetical protein [Xanthocytophaga flavus]MDJ1496821.1 hypothetical protein [Xanthocytophaga flavus]
MDQYSEKLISHKLVVSSLKKEEEGIIIRGGTAIKPVEELEGFGVINILEGPFIISQQEDKWLLQCNTLHLETYEKICNSFEEAVNELVDKYIAIGFLPSK